MTFAWKVHAHATSGPKVCGACGLPFVPLSTSQAPYAPDPADATQPGEPLCDACATTLDPERFERLQARRAMPVHPLYRTERGHLIDPFTEASGA